MTGLDFGKLKNAAPGLHEHLARAWIGAGNSQAAFGEYLLAARGFLDQQDRDAAQASLTEAQKLAEQVPANERRQLDDLQARLRM